MKGVRRTLGVGPADEGHDHRPHPSRAQLCRRAAANRNCHVRLQDGSLGSLDESLVAMSDNQEPVVGSERPDLATVLRSHAARLDADLLATAQIGHSGSKGRVREALLVEDVINRVLPETMGIAHGAEIVASDGSVAGECDIVIYDREVPALYRTVGYSVLPVEAVLGVIEVKSRLDKAGVTKAVGNCQRIKAMPHLARSREPGDHRQVRRHGRVWDHVPVAFHIFAFGSGDLVATFDHLNQLEQNRPRWARIESIYVVGKGWITNAAMNAQVVFGALDSIVLPMVIEFVTLYQRGWEPRFDLSAYFADAPLGRVIKVGGYWTDDGQGLGPPSQ